MGISNTFAKGRYCQELASQLNGDGASSAADGGGAYTTLSGEEIDQRIKRELSLNATMKSSFLAPLKKGGSIQVCITWTANG